MRRTLRTIALPFLVAALGIAATGCTVYRPEVRQGNFMDESKMGQVQPGMTREQVEFLIGPPMVTDPFHRDRWDYVFTVESILTNHMTISKHFVVEFDGDRVRSAKMID